jgi:hypothetical protein
LKVYQSTGKKLVLIFDEAQALKNTTAQYKAALTLARYILRNTKGCYLAILSGSLFDKEQHVVNYLRLLDIVQADKLYDLKPRDTVIRLRDADNKPYGLLELVQYCIRYGEQLKDDAIQLENTFNATYTPEEIAAARSLSDAFVVIQKFKSDIDMSDFLIVTGLNAVDPEVNAQLMKNADSFLGYRPTPDFLITIQETTLLLETIKLYSQSIADPDRSRLITTLIDLTDNVNAATQIIIDYDMASEESRTKTDACMRMYDELQDDIKASLDIPNNIQLAFRDGITEGNKNKKKRKNDNLQYQQEIKFDRPYEEYIDKNNAKSVAFKLFSYVIIANFGSAVPPPRMDAPNAAGLRINLDVKNGYYKFLDDYDGAENLDAKDEYIDAVSSLSRIVGYNKNTGESSASGDSIFTQITPILKRIEKAKVNIFIRIAKRELNRNPNTKIVIFLWFKEHLEKVRNVLYEYRPLYMTGDTKDDERVRNIAAFQQANDIYRLFIAQAKVGGLGISLDDQDGSFPRKMLLSCNYNFLDLFQATRRIYRQETRSNAEVRCIYGDAGDEGQELGILNSLSRKSGVLGSISPEQVKAGIKYPGDFDKITEDEENIIIAKEAEDLRKAEEAAENLADEAD